MITNPGAAIRPKLDKDELQDQAAERLADALTRGSKAPFIARGGSIKYEDPDDKIFQEMAGVIETRVVDVDAKIMEKVRRDGRTLYEARHYKSLREMLRSPQCIARVREHYTQRKLKDMTKRLIEVKRISKKELAVIKESQKVSRSALLREGCGDFALGLYGDEATNNPNVFPLEDTFLPSTVSPYSKQMLWADYQDMHRKCFEAATRNPIGKRICKIVPQFVLGRGVTGKCTDDDRQEVWDDFWMRNKMRRRLKTTLRELLIYGEIFYRYFKTRDGLVVRSIDPSTIWDIVTDPEDLENVLWYHQQYVIINRSIVPELQALIPATLIIRQIPAEDVYHAKINATSSEKRGRSELFAILGWLLRFKEFANDRVLLNKMRAMFALDVKVTGSPADVQSAQSQFTSPPGPGAVMVHNEAVDISFKNAEVGAAEAKTDAELILRIIAVGAGVSEQFLSVGGQTNRASALIQSEPDVKNVEDFRELTEDLLRDAAVRVFEDSGDEINPSNLGIEFTFPSFTQEDRSGKLKDIALAESMDYFSKERSATMTAREMEITDYDYDREQQQIVEERAKQPVISLPYQQVPKEAPASPAPGPGGAPGGDPNNPAAAGAAGPPKPSNPKPEPGAPTNAPPTNPGGGGTAVPHASAQAGFSAKKGGGRQLPNTKPTAFRPGFTPGSEKTKVANNRTSGTPQRQAGVHEVERPKRNVWSKAARERSLDVRRARAAAKRRDADQTPVEVKPDGEEA